MFFNTIIIIPVTDRGQSASYYYCILYGELFEMFQYF